ncbi:methyl-CpG-binding domain-containing protein 5-like [Impatiens glandulifera]|uniref:methyl-CpG-binding domain-containing protein 5-like n=1 Tax=Impatiens glandulifera TaxID=253017 RepID=UPI001FB14041|nr:methyl-CpG-binding domain-containing protein 5-like [Impatiens glandulifera]
MSDLFNNLAAESRIPPMSDLFNNATLTNDELLSPNRDISKPQERPTPISVNGMTPKRPTKIPSVPERPDWLPEGWRFEHKVRTSGVSAGLYDRYYIEPISKHRFRSKKEVEYFLETGALKRPASNAVVDADDNDDNEEGEQVGWDFDPKCVPEHVRWTLADSSTDRWDAFIGVVMVNQPTTKIWKDRVTQKNK